MLDQAREGGTATTQGMSLQNENATSMNYNLNLTAVEHGRRPEPRAAIAAP
jgi:hypothetical protein